jgi:hypothetical protein
MSGKKFALNDDNDTPPVAVQINKKPDIPQK